MVGSGEKRRRRSFIRGLGGGGGERGEELRLSPKSFLPLFSPQAEETPVGLSDLPNFKCVIEECGKSDSSFCRYFFLVSVQSLLDCLVSSLRGCWVGLAPPLYPT